MDFLVDLYGTKELFLEELCPGIISASVTYYFLMFLFWVLFVNNGYGSRLEIVALNLSNTDTFFKIKI